MEQTTATHDQLSQIISTLLKPLTFASKDDFIHLAALKKVEGLVQGLCRKALALPLSDKEAIKIKELQSVFEDFDSLVIEEKREKIMKAFDVIKAISNQQPAVRVLGESRKLNAECYFLDEIKTRLAKLSRPLKDIKGIGPKLAEVFKKKGLETVEDILYFLPIRYEDRRQIKKIAQLRAGMREVASGEIMALGEVFYGRRKVFEMTIGDGSGYLRLKWFHYRLPLMKKRYAIGRRLVVYGEINTFGGYKEIIHPDVEILEQEDVLDSINFKTIAPVYSQVGNLHQKTLRKIIRKIVEEYVCCATGAVPSYMLKRYGLMELPSAVTEIHKPNSELPTMPSNACPRMPAPECLPPNVSIGGLYRGSLSGVSIGGPNLVPADSPIKDFGDKFKQGSELSKDWLPRKSLVFDELFCLEMGLALKKGSMGKESGIAFKVGTPPPIPLWGQISNLSPEKGDKGGGVPMVENLRKMLPFKLTPAQERVISEIKKDMAISHPMNRLIQGDVGSGKTVVAFIASLIAIENKYQSAIMAPTEILAEQHYLNIRKYADGLGIRIALLTSALSKSERKLILDDIKNGVINLAIGTHALIQEDVDFKRLGLAIIDEQHRFGVVQRAMLKKKGTNPDILVMTATPIPRTLAMTVFGDLDISVIDELPPGRRPIITKVFREKDREQVYKIIKTELVKGRQAYIVYPLIEESEELELKNATHMAGHLQKDIFPEYKIKLLHGRMKAEQKEKIMKEFKEQETRILVSTTVIEVGIDVPNATVMVIEHAERFGLSQLHQLRGRVGRGGHDSYCFLLAGKIGSLDSYQRLKVMENTNDGFKIAEEDLKIRGPGDFLGTRQAGLPDFRVVNLLTDALLLQKARDEAFNIIKIDPDLSMPEHATVKEVVKARWKGRTKFATMEDFII